MWWQTALLGFVQGLTEFLPVSSSGHLLILQKLTTLPDYGLAFDAFLHLGTLLAVVIYFKKDIYHLITSLYQKQNRQGRYIIFLIIIGIIPAGLVGYWFDDFISSTLRLPGLVIFNLIFWALVMWLADIYIEKNGAVIEDISNIKWQQSLIIGLAQVISLLPGTSRSGITITAGLFQKINHVTAARFSFLMSIPLIAAAGLINFFKLTTSPEPIIFSYLVIGFLTSFLTGWLAISWLLKILSNGNLKLFVWYRLALSTILLIYIYLI
jgi:undecaprenyl-diphosphatase